MWKPRRLTTLWTSKARYRESLPLWADCLIIVKASTPHNPMDFHDSVTGIVLPLASTQSVSRLSKRCGSLDVSNPISLHGLLQGYIFVLRYYQQRRTVGWKVKDGSCGLEGDIFRKFDCSAERRHETPQSGYLVPWSRLDPKTSRNQVRILRDGKIRSICNAGEIPEDGRICEGMGVPWQHHETGSLGAGKWEWLITGTRENTCHLFIRKYILLRHSTWVTHCLKEAASFVRPDGTLTQLLASQLSSLSGRWGYRIWRLLLHGIREVHDHLRIT
jgi:hypothetical protein